MQATFQELVELFDARTPEGTLQGILVQKQVQGIELLLGLKRDPQFGPVLVAGAGGIYTEVLKDIARAFVPLTRERARCDADLPEDLPHPGRGPGPGGR